MHYIEKDHIMPDDTKYSVKVNQIPTYKRQKLPI